MGSAVLLGACASDPASNDPIEGVNRGVFAVNKAVDTVVVRPVAWTYREVMPDPFKDRLRDFLNNLKTPVVLANDLMQGNMDRAGVTFERFWINSILGLGGLIDIASSIGIPRHSEDFGQTLASWGVGEGPYLVLPLLGPSNPRDAVGLVVDYALDPLTWILPAGNNQELGYARLGTDIIDTRSRLIKVTDDLEKNSVDYYATMRSLYRQRRAAEISNGKAPMPTGMERGPAYPGQKTDE
ncbi:VacJ family lipoprotein [Lacibacterium aquatile]|uniref:VacJ family lipoprotein n=1 Tax=Lacibacterium aquatile TaxID=1168082 RepID=A0ABW5DWL0_9PROT